MIEIVRTNDLVLISFVESLLKDAGISHFVTDSNMSILEGSVGAISRRVLVDSDREAEARQLLKDACLERELRT